MADHSKSNESSSINDFWDAIQEIVSNDYIEQSQEEENAASEQRNYTYGMVSEAPPTRATAPAGGNYSAVNARKMETRKDYTDCIYQKTRPAYYAHGIPAVQHQQTHHRRHVERDPANNAEIAYLKAMLQGGLPPPHPSDEKQMESEDEIEEEEEEEEEDDKIVENIISGSPLQVKLEEMISIPDRMFGSNGREYDSNISDDQLMTLSVRDLNKLLRNLPSDAKTRLKQRRRLLKNRGYAQKCRNRRLYSQKLYCEENNQLKEMLEAVTCERDQYKAKYESLKNLLRKAKDDREQRKCAEDNHWS